MIIMDKIDTIIRTKSYQDLTFEEIELLAELAANEQEFNELKLLDSLIRQQKKAFQLQPKKETKESLDAFFQKKHAPQSHEWHKNEPKTIPFYQQNWMKYAAVVLLSVSLSAYFFLQTSNDTRLLAQSNTTKKTGTSLALESEPNNTLSSETKNKKVEKDVEKHLFAQINNQVTSNEKVDETKDNAEPESVFEKDYSADIATATSKIQTSRWTDAAAISMNNDDALQEMITVKSSAFKSVQEGISTLIAFAVPAF